VKITKQLSSPKCASNIFMPGGPATADGLAFHTSPITISTSNIMSDYAEILPDAAVNVINDAVTSALEDARLLTSMQQLDEQLRTVCDESTELVFNIRPTLAAYNRPLHHQSTSAAELVPKIVFEFNYVLPLGNWAPRRLCDGILTAWNFDILETRLPQMVPKQTPTTYIPLITNFDPEIDALGNVISLPNTKLLLKYNSTGKVPGGITCSPSILKYAKLQQEHKPLHYHNAVVAYAAKDAAYIPPPTQPPSSQFLVDDLSERLILLLWAYVRCHQQLLNYDLANLL